jgi:TolB-like protein
MKRITIGWLMFFLLVGQLTPALVKSDQIRTASDLDWARKALSRLEKNNSFPKREIPNSLALLYFSNHTGRLELAPLQKGLVAMLTADLKKIKSINIVPRGRLEALMEVLKLDVADLNDPVRMPRMGRLLGATYVLGGTIEKGQMAELEIIPQLLEVPNDILLEQPLVSGDLTDLSNLEKTLLNGIVAKMGIQLTPDETSTLQKPISLNPIALNSFFHGLEQSDQGNYPEAFNNYDKALAEDPDLILAQQAIDEMVGLGIVSAEGILLDADAALKKENISEKTEAESQSSMAKTPSSGSDHDGADSASEGVSRQTILIGAGLAAAAIGVGVAASGSSSGGAAPPTDPEPEDPEPEDPETPRVVDTRPDNLATDIPRDLIEITFHFNTPMDNTEGTVIANNQTWEINTNAILEWTEDFESLTIRRLDDDDLPSGNEVRLILNGFVSQDGEMLPEYTYRITIEEY